MAVCGVVLAFVAFVCEEAEGVTADVTALGAVTAAGPGVTTERDGVDGATLGLVALATGVLTVAGGTVTGATGTGAETGGVFAFATGTLTVAVGTVTPAGGGAGAGGVVTGGTVAVTTGAVTVTAGVFGGTPTAGAVTGAAGTVAVGTGTLVPGRAVPWAMAEPAHAPSASRETRMAGPRVPRTVIEDLVTFSAFETGRFEPLDGGRRVLLASELSPRDAAACPRARRAGHAGCRRYLRLAPTMASARNMPTLSAAPPTTKVDHVPAWVAASVA
ncbi:MAG: hypothetical protein QOH15_2427, partial [Gaiellales bacterium]|nr:hypothetical protein [Gaiellales bacterium]